MAGEVEEPFSLSFKSDSFHSGSVSFGRFESEDLSWERRSSFSHNKYLEEVEKYSKPGSVTEKKAYFEKHFKKKGMRLPGGGFISPGGKEYQSVNDDSFENASHREEEDNVNENGENVDYTEYDYEYAEGQYGHFNDHTQYGYFNESREGSEYEGKDCEREDQSVFTSDFRMDAASDNATVEVEVVMEHVKTREVHQSETESCSNNDMQELGTEVKLDNVDADVDKVSTPADPISETAEIDGNTVPRHQDRSPKVEASAEIESVKPVKSKGNVSRIQKNVSNHDRSKTIVKKQIRRERESPLRKKSEKQSPIAAVPSRRLLPRTPNAEDSRSNLASKSEKGPIKTAVKSQPSASKKVEPGLHRSPNRFKQTVSTTKSDTRTTPSGFSFRSDERAERRKQFYMKLEEKMHAKEAEMNQIQAKTQEKTEAEIKQLRRSLNFKATPMPSFYHGSAPSAGNKVTSVRSKTAKIHEKPTSSRAKSNMTTEPSEDQSTISSDNMKDGANQQRYGATEKGRVSRNHRAEGKPKGKGIGIGSNSGMSHLAVGVAS